MIVQMGASYVFNPFITLFAEQYSSGNIRDFWKTFRKCMAAIALISVVALGGGKILGHWGWNFCTGMRWQRMKICCFLSSAVRF